MAQPKSVPKSFWRAIDSIRGEADVRTSVWTALRELATEQSDGELTGELLSELLNYRTMRSIVGEHFSGLIVADFVAKMAEQVRPASVLDPTCGSGLMLQRVLTKCKPPLAHGVDINPDCCLVARSLLGETADIICSNIFAVEKDLASEYDLIIADAPLSYRLPPGSADKDGEFRPREFAEKLALWAARRLTKRGVLMMVVTPRLTRRKSLHRAIADLGFRFRALIHLPPGTMLATHIPTYLAVIERGPQESVFVGQLSSDPSAQQRILENFEQNTGGVHPSLGHFCDLDDFIDYECLEARYRLRQRLKGTDSFRAMSFDDVFVDLVRLRRDQSGPKLKDQESSEALYIGPGGQVITNTDQMPKSRAGVLRATINATNVQPEYFRSWIQSELGMLTLQSVGGASRLDQTTLLSDWKQAAIYIPTLSDQTKIVEALHHLNRLKAEISEIEAACWTGKEAGEEILKRARAVNRANSYEDWIESLPFPLATILWRHKVASDDPRVRIGILRDFFEALAAFLAIVHLIAFTSDVDAWAVRQSTLNNALRKHNLSLERATFGAWKCVVEYLGAQARKMLLDSEESDLVRHIYALHDAKTLESLLSCELAGLLGKANSIRNRHLGHGGALGVEQARAIEKELTDLVHQLRALFGRCWERFELVQATTSRYDGGIFKHRMPRLLGTRNQFENVDRQTGVPLESGSLYLLGENESRGLRLLPLIRVMASPKNVENTCYFFNRSETAGHRFVSYHFEAEADICECFQDTADALARVMSLSDQQAV